MTTFGDAFKAARSAGKTTFKFNGKSYHTKTKDEMTKTKKSVPVPTPRPDAGASPSPSAPSAKAAPKQNYPRPAKSVGIATAGSAIGQAAARRDNAPVSAKTETKPRQSSPGTPGATSAGKARPGATRSGSSEKPKQGPQPEGVWYAKKGSAISLAVARRRNAPSSK